MDRIDAMRVFARVVARGSFVRAAEDLRLPASTATDAVKQLEARLGVRLLQRTTRQVRATLDGEATTFETDHALGWNVSGELVDIPPGASRVIVLDLAGTIDADHYSFVTRPQALAHPVKTVATVTGT